MSQLNPVNKSFCLQQLYESNYRKLQQLIPQLQTIQSSSLLATTNNKPSLQLQVLEKNRYTLDIQLSYQSQIDIQQPIFEEMLHIRIYLDCKTAEILSKPLGLHAVPPVDYPKAALDSKWPANYLLDKWLTHCLYQGYRLIEFPQYQVIPA